MLDNNVSLKELIDTFQLIDNDIIDRGLAQTITPSTSNKVLPKGNYRGDITVKGDANLIASNILSGKSIFGVVGNLTPLSVASGSFSPSDWIHTVSGLAFKPNLVICLGNGTMDRNFIKFEGLPVKNFGFDFRSDFATIESLSVKTVFNSNGFTWNGCSPYESYKWVAYKF